MRLYLLPVLLSGGIFALLFCLAIFASGGTTNDLWSEGQPVVMAAAFPFSALYLLLLMPVMEFIKRRTWPTLNKGLVLLCAALLVGAGFSCIHFLLSLCGALSICIWLGMNWQYLRNPRLSR